MGTSTVFVNRNGTPAQNAKVVLSFANGGVTPPVLTNRDGQAVISHSGSGTASVIVNGRRGPSFRAPGTIAVEA